MGQPDKARQGLAVAGEALGEFTYLEAILKPRWKTVNAEVEALYNA